MLPLNSCSQRCAQRYQNELIRRHLSTQAPTAASLVGRVSNLYFFITIRSGAALGALTGAYNIYSAAKETTPMGYILMPVGLIAGSVLGAIIGPVSPLIAPIWFVTARHEKIEAEREREGTC